MTVKFKAKQRKAQILNHALREARDGRLYKMTIDEIADHVGVKRPTIVHYFGSMQGLRDAVVSSAIKYDDLSLIAQALAANDPLTEGIDADLRERAALSLAR